jgi:hypothetical protein
MANLQIVISALNKASGDLNKVKQDIQGIKGAGEDSSGAVKGFGGALDGLMGKAALVTGAVVAVGAAMKEVYETAREGAELDFARDKFDALAQSIGTTSTALTTDLRNATSGLVSDAELISSAGNMMSLGLAKSHDEVVRLSRVAGELDMNMNQLVLTLTNQTTMRFDALGVSVAGFDDKLQALKATGMDTQEAFTEAFLQQAEEQIGKVGSVAESAVGSFKLMESGMANLADAAKQNLLDVVAPAIESIGNYLSKQGSIAQAGVTFNNLIEDMEAAGLSTIKLRQEMYTLLGPNGVVSSERLGEFNDMVAEYYGFVTTATEGTQNWADANYEGAGASAAAQAALIAQSEAADGNAVSMQSVADATNNADAAMRSYSESLLFKIASEGLSESGAYALAIAMGLVDKNTVAATEQVNVYKAMLDSGAITQRQYNLLVENLANDIENLPEGKNLEVTTNAEEILDVLAEIEMRKFKNKSLTVDLDLDTSEVDGYQPPTKYGTITYLPSNAQFQAVGGAVYGGNPYMWQEYGYKGELFVPSSNGFVMSRADAERALSKALTGGGAAMDPDAIGKAVARALSGVTKDNQKGGNVYNLTMPTSSNPADVRTAFELMEAWA